MKAFRRVSSPVAVLDRPDVDTDQIIPKQFLKRIERTGFGQFLFFDWRLDAAGQPRPEFELNDPECADAKILIAGANFGAVHVAAERTGDDGRTHLTHRLACVVSDHRQLRELLDQWVETGVSERVYTSQLQEGKIREQATLKKFGNYCIRECRASARSGH